MVTDPTSESKDSFSHNLDDFLANDDKVGEFFCGVKSGGFEWNTKYNPTSKNGESYPRKVFIFQVPEDKELDPFIDFVHGRIETVRK